MLVRFFHRTASINVGAVRVGMNRVVQGPEEETILSWFLGHELPERKVLVKIYFFNIINLPYLPVPTHQI